MVASSRPYIHLSPYRTKELKQAGAGYPAPAFFAITVPNTENKNRASSSRCTRLFHSLNRDRNFASGKTAPGTGLGRFFLADWPVSLAAPAAGGQRGVVPVGSARRALRCRKQTFPERTGEGHKRKRDDRPGPLAEAAVEGVEMAQSLAVPSAGVLGTPVRSEGAAGGRRHGEAGRLPF